MKSISIYCFILFTQIYANENKLLFFGNCIACHGEVSGLAAPRLLEIKGYYLMKYPKKEDFVKHMATWLSRPNHKNSLLPEAIKKYKIMPNLAIDKQTLEKISTYIYEHNDFGVITPKG